MKASTNFVAGAYSHAQCQIDPEHKRGARTPRKADYYPLLYEYTGQAS